jgi:hypothetical protein
MGFAEASHATVCNERSLIMRCENPSRRDVLPASLVEGFVFIALPDRLRRNRRARPIGGEIKGTAGIPE